MREPSTRASMNDKLPATEVAPHDATVPEHAQWNEEELRLLHQISVSNLSYFKTQQWNVTSI